MSEINIHLSSSKQLPWLDSEDMNPILQLCVRHHAGILVHHFWGKNTSYPNSIISTTVALVVMMHSRLDMMLKAAPEFSSSVLHSCIMALTGIMHTTWEI